MLGGEPVLALVKESRVPEQTLHRWKHEALIDAGLELGHLPSERTSSAAKRADAGFTIAIP